jgi:autophagy-related protein 11
MPPSIYSNSHEFNELFVLQCSSSKKDEGDEFQQCIKVLSDKVGFISRQSTDLLQRCSQMETTHSHLVRELEEKEELICNLYAKLQLEKQVGMRWQVASLFDLDYVVQNIQH